MPDYHVYGHVLVTSAYKTAAQAWMVGATKRGKACEINLGAIDNPNATDTFLDWDLSRMTATGAGANTAWTPTPYDAADSAAINTSGVNATAEATAITANSTLKRWGMNQRNTLRWVAPQESQMLVWPSVAANGLVLRVLSSTYASSTAGTLDFME